MIKERIQLILKAGANVILTSKGIDDLCLKYLVEANVMGVRRCKKEDLRHLEKATGATLVTTLANLEGTESFDPSSLGFADEVLQDRIADDELILIKGSKMSKTASIILRGANSFMLDEMERSVHDSLCVVQRTLESKAVVPGGGAVSSFILLDSYFYVIILG
jgi:T-complex protein 1 subunit alpha